MIKKIQVGILTLLVLSSFSSMSNELEILDNKGSTYYVGGSGEGNYSTIQDAINKASDGDTVFVYNGTYFGHVLVDKSINFLGENKNTTIISGYIAYTLSIVTDGVYISGFTIKNAGRLGEGVRIDSNYNTFCNNIIHTPDDNVRFAGYNNTVSNNIIRSDSITLSGSNYLIAENVVTNDDHAINIVASNNLITNNSFINAGLFFPNYNYWNNTVLNNTVNSKPLRYIHHESNKSIKNITGQIILINCSNITIENQKISNATAAIQIWESNSCDIKDNLLSANHYGIWIHGSNNTITHNTITNNDYKGIILSGNHNIISKNRISNNVEGLNVDSSNNTIFNNIFDNANNIFNAGNNIWNVTKIPGINIVGGSFIGGNYWNDYGGNDTDDDGIGDTNIPHGPGDYLPLIMQTSNEPIADFTYSPLIPGINETITFTDQSTDPNGNITSWNWNFGDGTNSTEQHPTQSYNASDYYQVTLTVIDEEGDTNSHSKIVPVELNLVHIQNLSTGWNFISILFNNSFALTDFLVKYTEYYYDINDGIINEYLFGWNRSGQYYTFSDVLNPGYGYWLFSYEDCELWTEKPTPNVDAYITTLNLGWNTLGLPYNQSVEKTNVLVDDVEWNTAVSNGWISDFVFGWNRIGQNYEFSDTFNPGFSYWLYTYQQCVLKQNI